MKPTILTLTLATAFTCVLNGCDSASLPAPDRSESTAAIISADARANPALKRELARARAATARYHQLENALADGYVDIDVVIPNMGHHYLNSGLLDAVFEVERPELLVYAERPNGTLKLVAVEYAVPRDPVNPPPAPEGFTGDEDVWFPDTNFNLWTLHAWVWHGNPDGILSAFNPHVP